MIRASDLLVVEIETLKSAFFKHFRHIRALQPCFQPCHSPAGAVAGCQGSLKGIICFFYLWELLTVECGQPWSLGLSQTWKLHIFVSLANINNNCWDYLKLCRGAELFFSGFFWISGHFLSEESRESIPMDEWMHIQIPIADKQIYLLPCVPSVQDFCPDPISSACCLMGQVKLPLSSWRSWDFNIIRVARSSSTMAPVRRKILNFSPFSPLFSPSTVHKMLFMIPFKQ